VTGNRRLNIIKGSIAAAYFFVVLFGFARTARADITPRDVGHARIEVSGDRVEYFGDDALVVARGNVAVMLPDGSRVSGDAFAMDLHQQRLLVAGHVRFFTASGEMDGAAISDFLAFGRVYFLPLVPAADKWTFFDGDYRSPAKGRDMPGDAFAFPDVQGRRPYVSGRAALIDAGTYVEVEPATTAILMGPDTPPLPAFGDNFSANPAFGQNALPGAAFDAPYPFYGSSHTLETVHARYDQNRADPYYVSFEHHSVGDDGAYAVMALNALSQSDKQWNLLGYDPMGTRQALSLDAQLFSTQSGLSQPSASNGFADLEYLAALRRSSLLVDATQSYDAFVSGPVLPDHPFVLGLQWSGYQTSLGRSGFTYRLTSGWSKVHDAFGVTGTAARDVETDFIGATIGSPLLAGPFKTNIYASASDEHTWLSFPNQVDAQTLLFSDSKEIAPKLYGVLSALVGSVRTGDPALVFASPNVATGLTPQPLSPNGLPVEQFPTTSARAVDRTYAITASWQPTSKFQFGMTAAHSTYGPGQPFAPSDISLDARANVTRSLFVTIGRVYYFNYLGQRWSPKFSIQVSGQ
jgi:hypothetical protein